MNDHALSIILENMEATDDSTDLNGKILIAMPGMSDPRFDHSIIFLCSHSDDGSMGLIVNKPSDDLTFSDLLDQLDLAKTSSDVELMIYTGGPVEPGRGFILHSGDYVSNDSTLRVSTEFGMTATMDVITDISNGDGPTRCIFAMGYAGWGPGQLEAEIARNGWLICDASDELVFGGHDQMKWSAALATLGVNPLLLSAEGGRA